MTNIQSITPSPADTRHRHVADLYRALMTTLIDIHAAHLAAGTEVPMWILEATNDALALRGDRS